MTPEHLEKAEQFTSYAIGIGGLSYGAINEMMNTTNGFLHIAISVVGLAILVQRFLKDRRNNNKKDE